MCPTSARSRCVSMVSYILVETVRVIVVRMRFAYSPSCLYIRGILSGCSQEWPHSWLVGSILMSGCPSVPRRHRNSFRGVCRARESVEVAVANAFECWEFNGAHVSEVPVRLGLRRSLRSITSMAFCHRSKPSRTGTRRPTSDPRCHTISPCYVCTGGSL